MWCDYWFDEKDEKDEIDENKYVHVYRYRYTTISDVTELIDFLIIIYPNIYRHTNNQWCYWTDWFFDYNISEYI